ncbi:MAG: anti-sigma factor family protein [Chitinophagaceae bacterium]
MAPLHLTRDNYEEAFLMYVDEELNAEQKAQVEAFAALHPDLQEELDILLSTKLPMADLPALDKSFLMADSMKLNSVEEDLLLYIDSELPAAQAKAVEQKIKEDAAYNLQHQLLAKTKLDATEKIVYPYKEELYRKTERRIVYAHWWRVAAAAVVLLWTGSYYWSGNQDRPATNGPVALQTKTTTPTTQPTSVNNNTAVTTNNKETATEESAIAATITTPAQKEKQTFATGNAPAEGNVTYAAAETSVASMLPAAQRITGVQTSADFVPESRQQIFNDVVVTSAEPVRTISTDAHTTTPVPVEADVASAGQERGGSLKGFLRKTTRFIERTTSINPVNADDELLIGALAIKVK